MAEPRWQPGFTLLEVLVALVIVALGLMAAFGQVNQTLTAASRLREKTIAHWVAMNEMTRFRLLAQRQFPAIGTTNDEVEMARTTWRYTIAVVKGPVEAVRLVNISVAYADRPAAVVTALSTYITRPPPRVQAAAGAEQADWICEDVAP